MAAPYELENALDYSIPSETQVDHARLTPFSRLTGRRYNGLDYAESDSIITWEDDQ